MLLEPASGQVAGSHVAANLLGYIDRMSPNGIVLRLPNKVALQVPVFQRVLRTSSLPLHGEHSFWVLDLLVRPDHRVVPQPHHGVMFMKPLHTPWFFGCGHDQRTAQLGLAFFAMGELRGAYEDFGPQAAAELAVRDLMGHTQASLVPPFEGQTSLTLHLQVRICISAMYQRQTAENETSVAWLRRAVSHDND